MPQDHIVALLIAERDKLNQAIAALSGGTVTGKRRGRPPKSATAEISPVPTVEPVKPKRTWTAAQKKAAAERMKIRWAVKRKAAKA